MSDDILNEFSIFVTAMADDCGCVFHHVMRSGNQLIACLKEPDRDEFYNFQMSEYQFQDNDIRNQFKADMINKIEAIRMEKEEE